MQKLGQKNFHGTGLQSCHKAWFVAYYYPTNAKDFCHSLDHDRITMMKEQQDRDKQELI
jgi:hypothetical protein